MDMKLQVNKVRTNEWYKVPDYKEHDEIEKLLRINEEIGP